eukprot:TRINITY_DN21714_c0_g1_i1.p1 TRINITY_DN21714_c0_g1~~TRINITY_DN21714_c0_g1_i1.p1  ORF type:complete len:304 (-),score=72.38 TRINITY_DN21714_c0_g1_i1:32-943(-)
MEKIDMNLIFLLGDLQCLAHESSDEIRKTMADELFENYWSNGVCVAPLPLELVQEMESHRNQTEYQKDAFKVVEEALVHDLATNYLYSVFLRSCASAALYKLRSSGVKGNLPNLAYDLFRNRAKAQFWKPKTIKAGIEVLVEEKEGFLSWMERGTVPFSAQQVAKCMMTIEGSLPPTWEYKSRSIIEHLGPESYTIHVKAKLFVRRYDAVFLRSMSKLDDGSFVIVQPAVDYPHTKNYKRVPGYISGYLIEPIGTSSCRVSYATKSIVKGFVKKLMEFTMDGSYLTQHIQHITSLLQASESSY